MDPKSIQGRVIVPANGFIDGDGIVSDQAFSPKSEENYCLLTYNLNQTTSSWALAHYKSNVRPDAVGVLDVSQQELAFIGLIVIHNPLPNNPFHNLIDLSGFDKKTRRDNIKLIAAFANARKWLTPYPSV